MGCSWLLPRAVSLLVTLTSLPDPATSVPAPATPVPAPAPPVSAPVTPVTAPTTQVSPSPTPIFSPSSHDNRVSTPAGDDEGVVEGRGWMEMRSYNSFRGLNLPPVYPMLDATLGILSYAAFAVYIIMLFGGFLSRQNDGLGSMVAALKR
ncbi:hypothetical protein Hamer_G023701, partial [Homarus americanus]